MYLSTLLKRTNRLLVKRANEIIKPLGLNHAYTFILMELYNQDGLMQSELVQLIDVEQPTLVRTLDRMERDGLITRNPSPSDRRSMNIYLTAKAQNLQFNLDQSAKQLNKEVLKGFTNQDVVQLSNYLCRISDNLKISSGNNELRYM
ncbi:MarR family winged helix-turn-helix transcriptional regulator [Legionella waltersii]|uniref:MarR family transporter transcriptional regulator n=1 Tax=Legionella waltersii TaxID=66969 RepID=A0A0W1ALT1_9GAMM|nr:MarR family transcriptional regulator [Legionella waltersii]KTD82315.1 MarR family transporter transcriptional regulator [Legionella waltersii]SNV04089.1 transcriptional regulator [Legionella waltersii]